MDMRAIRTELSFCLFLAPWWWCSREQSSRSLCFVARVVRQSEIYHFQVRAASSAVSKAKCGRGVCAASWVAGQGMLFRCFVVFGIKQTVHGMKRSRMEKCSLVKAWPCLSRERVTKRPKYGPVRLASEASPVPSLQLPELPDNEAVGKAHLPHIHYRQHLPSVYSLVEAQTRLAACTCKLDD